MHVSMGPISVLVEVSFIPRVLFQRFNCVLPLSTEVGSKLHEGKNRESGRKGNLKLKPVY